MKQFTSIDQTAKLIELGFEKPKSEVKAEQAGDCAWYNPAYSIGELIEMLPKEINGFSVQVYHAGLWSVSYPMLEDKYYVAAYELCDALFEMLRYLKEEGVI